MIMYAHRKYPMYKSLQSRKIGNSWIVEVDTERLYNINFKKPVYISVKILHDNLLLYFIKTEPYDVKDLYFKNETDYILWRLRSGF